MRLKPIFGKAKKTLTSNLSDIVILLGGGLTFYGIYRIYQPASFIALGIALIYWALQIERGHK